MKKFLKSSIVLTSLALAVGTLAHADYYAEGTSRAVTVLNVGNVHDLRIAIPYTRVPVTILESGVNVVVTAEVSAGSNGEIDAFASSARTAISIDNDILLSLGQSNFRCRRSQLNGVIRVQGTCLDRLVVTVPAGSGTRVAVDGQMVRAGYAMSVPNLLAALSRFPFDSDKIGQLRAFVASHVAGSRFLSTAEAMIVLQVFTFDDGKIEAAGILSGHVSDPGNAGMAASVASFDSSRAKIVGALAR